MSPRPRLTPEARREMARLHVEQGLNLAQIAERFDCTRERVRQILRDDGVPSLTRSRGRETKEIRRVFRAVAVAARREMGERHGTLTKYQAGCRCPDCRKAATAAHRKWAESVRGKPPPKHGASGYSNYGCRCPVCRAGHAVAMRRARARRKARES